METDALVIPSQASRIESKITLTLLCNNDCLFCYNREDKQHGAILDEARVEQLIDEAAAAGTDTLNFIGGEVTIVPYFERVLAYAGARFETVSINTNGRRFRDPGFARRTVAAGLTHIDISLHGPNAAVHDFVSGAPGAFGDTTTGIRNLLALDPAPKVSVTTLVLDWNHHSIPAVAELLAELGVHSWRIKYSYGALGPAADTAPSDYIPRYAAALPSVQRAVDGRCREVNVSVHDVPICLLGGLLPYSTVFEDHAVARYTDEGAHDPERVVDKWGTRSPRCDHCAARASCCRVSPAYLRLYGDAELTPLPPDAFDALLRTAADHAPAQRRTAGDSDRLSAIFARLDRAAREDDWRAVRDAAIEALAVQADHTEAARMLRLAEFRILDRHIGRLLEAGQEREARKMRRYVERHYPDLCVPN